MPRPKNPVPTYRRHKASNRAYVRIDGKNVYLGAWGSDESKAEYDRVVRELRETGRASKPARSLLAIAELLDRFRDFARGYYRHPDGTPTKELRCLQDAVRVLAEMYDDLPAAEFGPVKLKKVREAMVDSGLARKVVNARVNRIRRVFRWAASEELIPAGVVEGLRTVEALRKGRTLARETQPVKPVPDEIVEATLPHLLPTVAAMVKVQRLTGCRPQDVCRMKVGEVDTSGDVWLYRPALHKTSYRGDERVVRIGPKAQEILGPFLTAAGFVFSPARAREERYAALRAKRKSKVQPSQANRSKPKAKLKRQTPASFTTEEYGHRIALACKKAGVARWSPNQLRHAHGSEVRRLYGLEAAQQALGHKRADVTQLYAERNSALAEKVAREVG